jgi:hypothetical protein
MTDPSRDDRLHGGSEDAWITAVAEHTEWGDRTPAERAAFRRRVTERVERSPARHWRLGTGLAAVATATVVLTIWFFPSAPVPVAGPVGGGFLSAAYYGDDDRSGTDTSYLPTDLQVWADALDESTVDEGAAS